MKYTNEDIKLAANTIRCLAADEVEQAKSGHPAIAKSRASCHFIFHAAGNSKKRGHGCE